MKISYSMLTHNEDESLLKLINFLVKHKDEEDEIVILDDFSDNPKTIEILDVMTSMYEMTYEQRHLLKDYAGQKNFLKNMCVGDYIFNLDADELPHKQLIKNIKPLSSTLQPHLLICSCVIPSTVFTLGTQYKSIVGFDSNIGLMFFINCL